MRRYRPGRTLLPRIRLNPHYVAKVKDSRLPYAPIARAAGAGESHFSYLLNAAGIPASPHNIETMLRVADAIRFPRDQVFLDELPVAEALKVTTPVTEAERAAERLERARAQVARLEAEMADADADVVSQAVEVKR